jgi:hypothetical protein
MDSIESQPLPRYEPARRKRDPRIDPPRTKAVPRHDAKARRIVKRYIVPDPLLDDWAGLEDGLREKFVEDCAAIRLQVNKQTIHVGRERSVPKGREPAPEGHTAIQVKAFGLALPGA